MRPDNQKPPTDKEQVEKHSAASELRRMVEQYAADLRRIVENLRKRLH